MEWIKCSDRLPEDGKIVLFNALFLWDGSRVTHLGWRDVDCWKTVYTTRFPDIGKHACDVTHWCEITPPEDV